MPGLETGSGTCAGRKSGDFGISRAVSYLSSMIRAACIVAIGLTPGIASADQSPEHRLEIVATAGRVQIAPGGNGRRAIQLPALRYEFQLLHRCAVASEPQSLSVTVADSHVRFPADALDADRGVVRASLSIPASQIPPVVVNAFCEQGQAEPDDGQPTLTLASIMSVSASLRCGSALGDQVTFSAAPLDVVLVCDAEAAASAGEGRASGAD